jgi:hypothetical protein
MLFLNNYHIISVFLRYYKCTLASNY